MVHIVHVVRAVSNEPSANGSDWPSKPARSIGTVAVASRFVASFQPASDGSTAETRCTSAG
jgi:hypothetical protein